MSVSGVRLDRKRLEMVAPTETIRPLRDRIVVKPLEWEPSRIISAVIDSKPLRGEVVATGPGAYYKRWYYNSNGERRAMGETGARIPIEVKVGDIVELGGLEHRGYAFPEILIGTERHLICQEADVCMVVENG